MRKTINKTKKSRDLLISTSKETKAIISEEDIRNRAYEIYQEKENASFDEMEIWLYAERELNGYYR
jgi:hypothetical protein